MDKQKYTEIKSELIEFYNGFDFQITFTGTFKQVLSHQCRNGFPIREFLTIEEAVRNVNRFLNSVSRKVFGPAQAKKGRMIWAVGYVEGYSRASVTGRERIHAHLLLGGFPTNSFDFENPMDLYRLESLLREEWQKSNWGWEQVEVRLLAPEGFNTDLPMESRNRWQEYIHKHFNPEQSERIIMRLPKR